MIPNVTGLGVGVAVGGNAVNVAVAVDVAVGNGVDVAIGVLVIVGVAVGSTLVGICLPAPHALNIIAKNKIMQRCADPKGFAKRLNEYSCQPTHFSLADVLIRQRNL